MNKKTPRTAKSSAKKSKSPSPQKQALKDLDAGTKQGTNDVRGGTASGINRLLDVTRDKTDNANTSAMDGATKK